MLFNAAIMRYPMGQQIGAAKGFPMRMPLMVALVTVLALGACGSRLNPLTWFGGGSTETLVPPGGWDTRADARLLVPVITEMEVLNTSTGALVRAVGQTESAGAWDVELRPINDGRPVDGALIYEFVFAPSRSPVPTTSDATRRVDASVAVSNTRLAGARQIIVRGAQNARSMNR